MAQKFEYTVLDMIEQASRTSKTSPLNLGGVAGAGGGVGGPPGGFIGQLPQYRVAYDTLEAATLATNPSGVAGISGWSLVDNLNHIRFRLNVLESGGSIIVTDDNTPATYYDVTEIHFSGAGVVVTDLGGGEVKATISATGSGGGGLTESAANALYLRLDTNNNPLTGGLEIVPDTANETGAYVETQGNATVLDLEQYSNDAIVDVDFIFGYQEAGDGEVSSIFLDGVRWSGGTGAFTGNWVHFEENNVAKFDVDKNGYAYTQGVVLVTASQVREKLTGNRTYYVRTDGNDSNTGLANTSGSAFLTVQKAINTIITLDLNGYTTTVQIADGTYTGGVDITVPWLGGSVTIQGNSGTPSNVVISTTSDDCFLIQTVFPGTLTIKDMKLQTATSGNGIRHNGVGVLNYQNIDFGTCVTFHVYADGPGAYILATGNYSITGGCDTHWVANLGGSIVAVSITVTLTGTPAFSAQFAYSTTVSSIVPYNVTFTGSATGVRYLVNLNAVINTVGGGANYLPGNSAGSTATGGQYA